MKIACVGAGPAGLYFSILMKLRDGGHDITVLERSRAGSGYGWGVVFSADLLAELYRHDRRSAHEIEQAAFRWVDQVAFIRGQRETDGGSDGYSITRHSLLAILAKRADELGVHIDFAHEVGDRADVRDAELIVASDGVNSRLRAADSEGFGTEVVVGSNKYLWLGTDKVFTSFTFPFVHTASGWLWAHTYGIDDYVSTFIVECSPETWKGLGFDTLPTPESLAVLESLFAPYLDCSRLLAQVPDGAPIGWLNFRTITNRCWHQGNVVLVGDAAHTTHFSIGLGTKLAMEDSIALASSLNSERDLPAALEAYEAERKAALAQPQGDARLSAQWFENVPRYIGLKPHQCFALLNARRSPLMTRMPPPLYYWLREAFEAVPVLGALRKRVGSGLGKRPPSRPPRRTPGPAAE